MAVFWDNEMPERTKIRCHICAAVVESTEKGTVAQHQDKSGKKLCYGSFSPILTGSRGEIMPGELVLKNARVRTDPYD